MREVIVECEFITPAFTYGENKKLEIRGSTLKGMMRHWWDRFEHTLEIKSEQLFGNDEQRGKVNIIGKHDYVFQALFHFNEEENKKIKIDYFFNKMGERYEQGERFNVTLKSQEKNDEKEKVYIEANLDALNFLQLFGGIGSRSKKFGGNFRIKNINGYVGNEKKYCSISIENYIKYVQDYLLKSSINASLFKYKIRSENKSNNKLNRISNCVNSVAKIYKKEIKKSNLRLKCVPITINKEIYPYVLICDEGEDTGKYNKLFNELSKNNNFEQIKLLEAEQI